MTLRHRPGLHPGTRLAGAVFVLLCLAGAPAAADEGGHGDDVAEWPEWAQTEESHDDHGDESGPAPDRPRTLVLGSFAAVNAGVLLSAALLRRRTKGEVDRRRSARAAALRATEHAPPTHDRTPRPDHPHQP